MDAALIASAALLGLAGTPHCAAMCGAPCAAVSGRGWSGTLAFQGARLGGYAVAGAVAAGSVGALAALSQLSPALRPVWAMLHAMILVLGLWMLWQGRQPAWMGALGRTPTLPAGPSSGTASEGRGWQPLRGPLRGPLRAATAGGLWVAWPCGLLQSALLVASLTGSPAAGAGAMAGFALASSGGLIAAPWIWQRLRRGGTATERWLVRAAGALLVVGSVFALGQGVWHQIAAFCGLA